MNWAFYHQLQKKVKMNYNAQMLNIGSCGLHVVHDAFKHGVDASKWDTSATLLMRAMHSLFNETPARREDYSQGAVCSGKAFAIPSG